MIYEVGKNVLHPCHVFDGDANSLDNHQIVKIDTETGEATVNSLDANGNAYPNADESAVQTETRHFKPPIRVVMPHVAGNPLCAADCPACGSQVRETRLCLKCHTAHRVDLFSNRGCEKRICLHPWHGEEPLSETK